MFDDLVNSLLQESFRPVKSKERLSQLRSTPQGAFKATLITKKRDPAVEKALLGMAEAGSSLTIADLVNYANIVIQDRWPEAEQYILKSPYASTWYAAEVIQDRWPEAEAILKDNARLAAQYARHVIKGRFEEAEPTIMRDPDEAVEYAIHVLHHRWPEAEPYIKTSNDKYHYWRDYKDYFGIEEED